MTRPMLYRSLSWLLSFVISASTVGAAEVEATPAADIVAPPGFTVERLYSVPANSQGSWVSLTFDPQGRMIASDQYGALYRITPPPIGSKQELRVEPLKVDIGHAQGLLFTHGSLYVVVNDGGGYKNGLYRVRDTDGDDQFDEVKLLRAIKGKSEHGPHAVVLGPDGESLYIVAGNFTALPDPQKSRPARNWEEDQLLPRIPDGGGHDPHIKAPAGWVCKTDLNGKEWELFSLGMRNTYDIAFNNDGELFGFDSDMEWDINAPWYRPTRVGHLVSGSDFGWRNGSGKFPPYYPDSCPPAIEIGPGSPTGVTFGYGAKFPAKYQNAFFINDWSYGIIYAAFLEPDGASYKGTFEKFVTGQPLPVTDSAIGPDGALYFATGGRNVQSGLYRVIYTGPDSTAPVAPTANPQAKAARELRHKLEAFHGEPNDKAVDTAWPYLSDVDRFLRQAARIALEHQPVAQWQERALAETNPWASLTALIGLVRSGDKSLQSQVLAALGRLDWNSLDEEQRLALIRAYDLTFIRLGTPNAATASAVAARFEPYYPSDSQFINRELALLLCYLEAPSAVAKTIDLLENSTSQEQQVHFALALRNVKTGWTHEARVKYFNWFQHSATFKGGHSYALMVRSIKKDAIAALPDDEKESLGALLNDPPKDSLELPPRPFVKNYTYDEVLALCGKGLTHRNFEHGRQMFSAAQCASCHRFAGEGGIGGPDLTAAAGRFQLRDLLDSIFEPSKTISDQYQATMFIMEDGRQFTGRVVNMNKDKISVLPNLLAPDDQVDLKRGEIAKILPSKTSMMPTGLLSTLKEDELLDLLAYVLSRGDKNAAPFK